MTKPKPQVNDEKKAYSYDSLAEAVELSTRTLRNKVDAGELIAYYPTSEPRFPVKEVERWISTWAPTKPAKKTDA